MYPVFEFDFSFTVATDKSVLEVVRSRAVAADAALGTAFVAAAVLVLQLLMLAAHFAQSSAGAAGDGLLLHYPA